MVVGPCLIRTFGTRSLDSDVVGLIIGGEHADSNLVLEDERNEYDLCDASK